MKLKWAIEYTREGERKTLKGTDEWKDTLLIEKDLTGATLHSVKGTISLPIPATAGVFLNGYQTWTHSPEYGKDDRIRGLHRLPKALVKRFSLDHYGDYHFVPYPYKRGITHGFSFMTVREGEEFTLLASLSERTAWTMFTLDRKKGILTIERDVEGKVCDGVFPLFSLYTTKGYEEDVYASYAKALGTENTKAPIAGYSSWYNHYEDISSETIHSDLKGAGRILEKGDLFQIDDGWEVEVGEWDIDRRKFPEGLQSLVEEIHRKGYQAGLWLAPFVAETNSFLYKEHQDWFLHDEDGKLFSCGCNWSGFYSLDIDNKEFRAYLEKTFRTVFDEWGFDLVKLDFLYGAAPFGKPGETRSERMFRAMDWIREMCRGKLILGCGIPVAAGFGTTDYSRVSCDVGLNWIEKPYHREMVNTMHAVETSFMRRNLRSIFHTDPDVFFLRKENISYTKKQKEFLATMDALNQGVFLTSDNPSLYTEEQVKKYKALRHIWKDATDIYVTYTETEGGVSTNAVLRSTSFSQFPQKRIHYTLDGKEHTFLLPF